MTNAPSTTTRIPADWTVDTATGRSNSSAEFTSLVKFVGELIRGHAAMLMGGQADAVGQLIMAQLAHLKGLVPSHYDQGVQIESVRLEDGRLVGILWFGGQRLTFTTETAPDPMP